MSMLATTIVMIYVFAVAIVDVRSHRIPNRLSLAAVCVGLSVQSIDSGMLGLFNSLGGMVVGLIMFMPFYVLRAFGAGDVKAMAAVGAFLGPQHAVLAAALTLMAGAVIGVAVLWRTSYDTRQAWHRLLGTLLAPMVLMRGADAAGSADPSGLPSRFTVQKFPYGVAIACGAVLTLWWTDRLSFLFGQWSG